MPPKNPATTRLGKELKRLADDPIPMIVACPREENIMEWRFVMKGSDDEGSPYSGGYYMGKLVFPPQYPWKPPSVLMCTPSGRFETDRRICLSISDYHPETWSPSWNVGTILLGIISFFHETTSTLGSLETTDEAKKRYASESKAFNSRDKIFVELFGSSGDASEAFAEANAQLEKLLAKKTGGSTTTAGGGGTAAAGGGGGGEKDSSGSTAPTITKSESADIPTTVFKKAKAEKASNCSTT